MANLNQKFLIFCIAFLFLAACSKQDKIAARVDGFEIRQTDLQNALKIEKQNYDPLLLKVEENKQSFKKSVLNKLIQEAILINEAKKNGLNVTKADLAKIAKVSDYDDYWLERQKRKILINKLINKMLDQDLVVSNKQIKSYYQKNKKDFFQPMQYHARQIIFDDKQMADQILAKIKKGEDFTELAKKHSLSPDAERGGDLGFFDAQDFPPVFGQVCKKLETGEISEVIKTEYGYQIFQLLGKRKGRQKSFKEVSENIEFLLKEKQGQKIFNKWFADLQNQAKVQINQQVFEEVELDEK